MLEGRLRSEGLSIEVANLGKPGSSPTNYADIAEKSFSLLHPDLLIVAVLQGDDVAQMGFPPVGESQLGPTPDSLDTRATHPTFRKIAKRLYPNLLRLIDRSDPGSTELAGEWQSMARASYAVLPPSERTRLDELDDSVKKAFFAGELNPSLVYLAVHSPDYFMETMSLNSPTTRGHITQVADELRRIRAVADQNNAKAIVVSMPYGIYVSKNSFASRQRLGFAASPQMLTSDQPDEAIKQAAQLAGLEFYEVTREFRDAAPDHELFFALDGHLNRDGHALFARAVTPFIRLCVKSAR